MTSYIIETTCNNITYKMVSLIGSSVSEVCHKAGSEFEESTMTDNKSHTPTVSVLGKLKAPKHSDLIQKTQWI